MSSELPDLDRWLPNPLIAIVHQRETQTSPEALWRAAASVQVGDTRRLGRLVRTRIPGVRAEVSYDALFRAEPFNVLAHGEHLLISGLVGRIWTLKRDYPVLSDPEAFRAWHARGTVRVLFATWVTATPTGAALITETRVDAVDRAARFGLRALSPLIRSSHSLIGTEGLTLAVRRAEIEASLRPA